MDTGNIASAEFILYKVVWYERLWIHRTREW
jgi:hypothetical protein